MPHLGYGFKKDRGFRISSFAVSRDKLYVSRFTSLIDFMMVLVFLNNYFQ